SYITNFTVDAVSRTDNTTTSLKMDSAALRLLRGGYTLIHWETPDKLATGTYYDYVIRLYDRSGNEFSVTYVDSHGNVISRDDANTYSGHTCRKEPTVEIEIPNSTNVEGSTRLDVTWRNVEGVPVSENTGSSALEGLGVAALYIVRQGDEVKPENAINLVATQPGGSAVTNAKYLPIGTANATVNTSWVVTNLTSMRQYVAAVVCGYYDIDDGRKHYNETLKETTQFLTASLSNLGTIPYGWNVDNVWYDAARLNLRVLYNPSGRYFNPRLLNLVSSAELEVKNAAGVSLGTVVLSRDLLRTIPLSSAQYISADAATGLRRFDVSAPVQWNDEDEPRVTVMSLLYDEQPAYVDGDGNTATPSTVWDYLLATSGTGEDCWLSLQLGSLFEGGETRLMALEPKSDYTGTLRFYANQGDGEKQNVTSVTSKDIAFSTISRDAVVHFDNAFISSTFIELIHLRIADPDECVMPDENERDGNNVLVEILDSTGYRVASTYINSKREYETFRLTGLTNNETYTLRFHPPRYTNQGLVSLTKYLDIAVADIVDEANPTEFRFVTGASVSGSLALNSLEQYYAPDQLGEADQTQLGLLSDDDFYDGVWANERNYYYTNSELKNEQFVDLVDEKERDLDETLKAQLKGMTGTYNATSMPLTLSYNSSYSSNAWRNYSWTTRMIAVQPGELYSLFNCNPTTNFRIHFFFVNSNGKIQWTEARKYNDITSYYYGNVFEVPDRSDYQTATQTNVCFMRISGYTDKGRQGIVLERYDPERTKALPDMTQGVTLQYGSSFNSSGVVTAATGGHGFGYTVDYIPVTGGSVYELIGRDENLRDYEGGRRNPGNDSMLSVSNLFFYDASYRYLGCFTVGNQVALVKAPYGAVYCRFNIRTYTNSGTTDIFTRSELLMKEYRAAITDKYIGTVELELADASEEQILNGGSYTVRLYQTASAVAESVNLSAYTHWEYLSSYNRTEVLYSSSANKLNKKELLRPYPNLPANRGFRAVLSVRPAGWNFEIPLDTLYFNTARKVRTISNLADLYSILNDPAGSYIVTADISGVGRQILDATRPFSGTIDFQGHKITMTTADPLFDRINANGIVRNLELTHRYRNTTKNASAKANSGSLALNNYGTIENVVLNYDIYYQWAPYERSGGGIVYLNYGTIDGFVVNFRQDLRTVGYFGGVAYGNGGTIRNGYITGEVQENGRRAGIVSVNPKITYTLQSGDIYTSSKSTSGDAGYLGYCVGSNYLRGTVENVFVVTDQLTIQSSDVEKDNDLTSGDASATNTNRSALLVGSSNGAIRNCFVVGDRVDQKATLEVDQDVYTVVDERVMDARGPVVSYVDYLYVADNLTYFSPRNASYRTMTDDYNKTTSDTTYVHVGDYNQKGDPRSLYDYKWYEGVLGADGDRFIIRDNLERGNGYYPQLILPDCFADDAQPLLPLLGQSTDTVRILDHTVRMIGKDAEGNQQALVTITINNPRNRAVTDFVITDSNENNGKALSCEVLGQRSLNGTCRVDVLLGIGTAKAADEYTIHQVKMESTLYNAELTDERVIFVSFWNEIWNASEYITKLSENRTLNYRLAADLDFSQSRTSNDWYLSSSFFGKLDGGIYAYEEQPLLSDAGDPILAEGTENMRTMFVQGELIGMHTISGVGNVTVSGSVSNDRYTTNYKGALFRTLYGTLKNIVFSNFVTRSSGTAGANAVNSASSGVVIDMNGTAVIDNCHVRDSVFSGRGYVGPLVANMEYGTITNCSARNVEVVGYRTRTGTDALWVGGLVGRGNKGTIRGCFAADVTITAPDVYSVDGIGGVVGGISDGVLLESCYSTGSIEANCVRVGGIVGHLRGSGSKTVGCWSTATVVTTSDYAGSIVGYYEAGIMTNNYALGTVLSRASSTSNVHRVASNI
ncbi:MAG: hypothetical protein IJV64_01790, partial [Oscillospiraceae bacterium]|nr:hypothetical protein [Oscillospiraceae bacterium]